MRAFFNKLSGMDFLISKWGLVICFLVLLEPPFFRQSTALLDIVFNIAQVTIALAVVILYGRKLKISLFSALLVAYYGYLLFVTAANGGAVVSVLTQAGSFIVICLLVELSMAEDSSLLFSTLLRVLEVFICINFLTVILFPDGLYSTDYFSQNYFLGYRNQIINYVLPCICLELLNIWSGKEERGKAMGRAVVMIAISFASVLLVRSGGSTVVVAMFVVFFLVCSKLPPRYFNFKYYFALNAILFFAIVVFRQQDIFSGIINALGKTMTFSGRTYIWDTTFDLIKDNFIFGYGLEHYSDRVAQYAAAGAPGAVQMVSGFHAHDRYLETVFRGGLVLLVLYLSIIFVSGREMVGAKATRAGMVVSFSLFMYLTGMLTEYYEYSPLFFVLLCIGYHVDTLPNREIECEIGSLGRWFLSASSRFKEAVSRFFRRRFSSRDSFHLGRPRCVALRSFSRSPHVRRDSSISRGVGFNEPTKCR